MLLSAHSYFLLFVNNLHRQVEEESKMDCDWRMESGSIRGCVGYPLKTNTTRNGIPIYLLLLLHDSTCL